MIRRRPRTLHLLALAALAAMVPLTTTTGPAAATYVPCGEPIDGVVWTGGGGDELWDNPANWTDAEEEHRLPTPQDAVCIDTGFGGPLRAPNGFTNHNRVMVDAGPNDPPVVVAGDAEFFAITGRGRLALEGEITLTGLAILDVAVDVAGDATVTLEASLGDPGFEGGPAKASGPVTVDGTLHLRRGSTLGSVAVGSAGRVDVAGSEDGLGLLGALDIGPGGSFVVGEDVEVTVATSARLLGSAPVLEDVFISHAGPFPLTATGDVHVGTVGPGATLLVRPDAQGDVSVRGLEDEPAQDGDELGDVPIVNRGTLDIAGPPLEQILPHARVRAPMIDNAGALVLDRVEVATELVNTGTALLGSVHLTPSGWELASLDNRGRVEVRPADTDFLYDLSALVTGAVENEGTIGGPSTALLLMGGGPYAGSGRITAPLFVGAGTFSPGPRPFTVPSLKWDEHVFDLEVEGLAAGAADRFAVSGTVGLPVSEPVAEDTGVSTFELDLADGYVPCAGARLQLMTWGQRVVADPVQTDSVVASELPAGLTVRLVERFDGFVAVVTGVPDAGEPVCSDAAGARLVSGWFVDGLGRPARPEQLAAFGARANPVAGRSAVARELLLGDAAVRRFANGEFRRILGRAASPAALQLWTTRLRQGWTPDRLRAETYAGTAFWASSGSTPQGWTRALYRAELGREPTATQLATIVAEQRRGVSRVTIAARLLAGGEADHALVTRSAALWWGRWATAAERSTWAGRYQRGAELTVTADLAAATQVS